MNIIVYRYRRRPRRRLPFTAVATTKSAPLRRRNVNRWRRIPKKIVWPLQQRFVFTKTAAPTTKSDPLPPAARRRVRWPQPKVYWRTQQRMRFVVPGLTPTYTYRQITLYDRSNRLTVQSRSGSLRLVNRTAAITLPDIP